MVILPWNERKNKVTIPPPTHNTHTFLKRYNVIKKVLKNGKKLIKNWQKMAKINHKFPRT